MVNGAFSIMEVIIQKQNIKELNQNLMSTDNLIINDEREEGEIIDDYELILSSEEEYSVRERMRELEATNNEIEQIAEISGSYANNYNYCSGINFREKYQPYKHLKRDEYVVSDISSISSDEFHVPKKKRRRTKKHRSKRLEQTCKKENSSKHGKKRNHLHRLENKKPRRNVYLNKQSKQESNLSDLDNSVLMNRDMKYWEDDNEYVMNGINREKLRFALAHDTKRDAPIGSLRERLENKLNCLKANTLCQETKEQDRNHFPQNLEGNKGVIIDCESNSGDSMDESELRLIALKSAVLNKHNLRKKRNAEMAYSPTDFIESEELKNIGECDIDDIMEISPAESPIAIDVRDPLETSVNMKPVDMDIVTSEESDSGRTQDSNPEIQWPLPTSNYNKINNELSDLILQCGLYFSGLKPGGQLQNLMEDEEPPPPPPFYISKEQQLDEDSSNNSYNFDANHTNIVMEKQSMPIRNRIDLTESSDEEEKALRALLLSNHKFVKRDIEIECNEIQPTHELPDSVSASLETKNQKNISFDENEDPEELRSLLLLSMKNKDYHGYGSPSVLKEAVLRFQLNSKNNNYLVSISNEENKESESNHCNTLPMEIMENEGKIPPIPPNNQESVKGRSNTSNVDKFLKDASVPSSAEKLDRSINSKNMVKSQLCTKNEAKRSSESQRIVLKDQTESKFVSSGSAVLNIKPLNSKVCITKPKDTLMKTNPTLKIVKPNKVINKNSDLNPRAFLTFANQQQPTREEVGTNFNRLLTKADLSKLKVKRMVINLSNLTSESEESNFSDDQNEQNMALDSIPLTYSDNASPISLPMESPCRTPPRLSTPSIENTETPLITANLRKSAMNEFFEKKLDDFLKQARINVEKTSGSENKLAFGRTEKENSDFNANGSVGIVTPLSVRHLPAASQQEYRFLVERMKILEKRKEFRSSNISNNNGIKLSPKEVLDIEDKSHPAICTVVFDARRNERNNSSQGHLCKISSSKTVNKSLHAKSAIPKPVSSLQTKDISQNSETQSAISSSKSKYSLQTNVRSSILNLSKTPSIVLPASVQLSSTNTELVKLSPTKNIKTFTSGKAAVTVDKCKLSRTFSVFPQSSINPANLIEPDPTKIDAFADKSLQFKYSKKNCLDKSMLVVEETTLDRLHTLQSSYTSIGADMISHLNKTLVMVEQAKTSKIAKLRHDKRLKELHKEVNEVTLKLKYEKMKVSQIQPHIHQSNDLLSQLKMRRTKLYNTAMYLGKTIQGISKYRLYDEATTEITQKFNKLSREIQLLNSLKTFDDIQEIEETGNVDRNQVETETVKYCENKDISNTIEIKDFAEVKMDQLTDRKEISNENCENIVKMDENSKIRKFTNQKTEGSNPLISNSEKIYEKNTVLSDINVHNAPSESLPKNLNKTNYNDKNQQKETQYTEPSFKVLINQPLNNIPKKHYNYISPLQPQTDYKSSLNPDRLVCPYDLMGNCEDTECSFLHL